MRIRKVQLIVTAVLLLLITSCKSTENLFIENSDSWEATGNANWSFSNKVLTAETQNGEGYLATKNTYKNFILEVDFKPDSTINTGVFIRCKKGFVDPTNCYELNIWDLHPDQDNATGSIVLNTAPLVHVETINKWNTYKIIAQKNHIQVWINNILTADTTDDALSDGYVGLQAKGNGTVSFRNIRIKALPEN